MVRVMVLVMVIAMDLAAQSSREFNAAFDGAAKEFGVPAQILKGIAFAETRWEHLQWADGDTASCTGMPRPYGVMALWDNRHFGHSLNTASALLGSTPEALRADYRENIRGAAALLSKLHRELPMPDGTTPGELESWSNAIATYSGIPQSHLSYEHALDVMSAIGRGYHKFHIAWDGTPVKLERVRSYVKQQQASAIKPAPARVDQPTDQPDYPGAKWVQAGSGHWYTSGYGKWFVIIHDMEGYYLSTISYFADPATQVSAHFCVNGLKDNAGDAVAGEITQMVELQYWAWHVGCWNRYTVGIEHEGFAGNPAWYSQEMYDASAALTKWLCDRYSIPKDRNHIIAHGEWQNSSWANWVNGVFNPSISPTPAMDPACNSHTDPGPFWDWDYYMKRVTGDSTSPKVVSTPPAQKLGVYDQVSVTFSQRMNATTVEQAFHLTPSVAGSLSWADNFRTVKFTPSSSFAYNTTYLVKIDSTAKSAAGAPLDGNGDGAGGDSYSFTFQTVELDTIPPQIVSIYPSPNQLDISTSLEFIVQFNEPMNPDSINASFSLKDGGNNPIALTGFKYSSGSGFSRVRFRPSAILAAQQSYTVTVSQLAKDYGGNSIPAPQSVLFSTETTRVFTGNVINAVDAVGSWWQPSTSGSTVNVLASFAISSDPKKAGTGSGKLTYSFTGASAGYLREHNASTPSIEGGSLFGTWVFGDNSGNQLEYWFYYPGGAGYIIVPVGVIDWTGWKLKTVPTSSVPVGSGTGRRFTSVGIKQLNGAQTSGEVYFDELTIGNSVTDVAGLDDPQAPSTFALQQNYPNPFNPSTTLQFSIPADGRVVLRVYDLVGRVVATLADEQRSKGTYRVTFDGSAQPSGTYFAVMQSGGQRLAVRMMLLK